MPTGPVPPRKAASSSRAPIALLLALIFVPLVPGCREGRSGDSVEVDVEQQKEINKLLTEDYSQMYREKYQGQAARKKAR